MDIRKRTGDILLELGITPDLSGFHYIVDLVEIIYNNQFAKICTTYVFVAEKYNKSSSKVERCVRHAIGKINTTTDEFCKYIGANVSSPETGKPTNSAFLFTLAHRLTEESKQKEIS